MTNSADPDQLVCWEANWSGCTLFTKAGSARPELTCQSSWPTCSAIISLRGMDILNRISNIFCKLDNIVTSYLLSCTGVPFWKGACSKRKQCANMESKFTFRLPHSDLYNETICLQNEIKIKVQLDFKSAIHTHFFDLLVNKLPLLRAWLWRWGTSRNLWLWFRLWFWGLFLARTLTLGFWWRS